MEAIKIFTFWLISVVAITTAFAIANITIGIMVTMLVLLAIVVYFYAGILKYRRIARKQKNFSRDYFTTKIDAMIIVIREDIVSTNLSEYAIKKFEDLKRLV